MRFSRITHHASRAAGLVSAGWKIGSDQLPPRNGTH
jgi:hypothetical protein